MKKGNTVKFAIVLIIVLVSALIITDSRQEKGIFCLARGFSFKNLQFKCPFLGKGVNTLEESKNIDTSVSEVKQDLGGKPVFVSGKTILKPIEVSAHFTGIVWDNESPKAVVNDEILSVGDKIEDKTIVEIQDDSLVLTDGTAYYELKLWKEQ